ncbi:hypothetical protein [Algoriphagus marinus]|uniref:hypothetical protein n=1 Tax=Algoriphagus marinus TaxID=1925762 RepID=UPI00094B951A|nr:hypothetical protein [Algoriphagus marinus]
MKKLKVFKSHSVALMIALNLFFLPSCVTEKDYHFLERHEFNYSTFEFFKKNLSIVEDLQMPKGLNPNEKVIFSKNFLIEINNRLGTDVKFTDSAFELINKDRELIFETSLKQGWIDLQEVELNNMFYEDLQSLGFDLAIKNYESKVLNLNLTQEEFLKKNRFINLIKALEFSNPKLFVSGKNEFLNLNSRISCDSGWRCAGAIIALTAATASLSSCATVLACGGAILLHIIAIDSAAAACDGCADAIFQ